MCYYVFYVSLDIMQWQSGQCRAMAWTAPHSGRISLQVGLVVR